MRQSASFIDAWQEAPSAGGQSAGHLHLAFLADVDARPAGVCLAQAADGAVQGVVYGDAPPADVRRQAARILSLDVDGREWPSVGARDSVVAALQRMFPGFRPVNWSNAYEAAAWSLISARISIRQGQAIKERMCRELGEELDIHGHRLFCFPAPNVLARLTSFRGLVGRKLEYMNGLGAAALRGELDTERLRAMSRDDALLALKRLPGVGDFAAGLVRLRALSAVDELPTTEPRLVEAVRQAYGLAHGPDRSELERIAARWRPFRTWVAVHLRRAMGGGGGRTHSRAPG